MAPVFLMRRICATLQSIRHGVQKLMSELLSRDRMAWKTCFSLAACTYLGSEWTATAEEAGEGTAELVAVRHGSEVAVGSLG